MGEAQALRTAVRQSYDRWTASMECACDNGLAGVKTDGDLQVARQEVANLQAKGERLEVVINSWSVETHSIESATSASAMVDKNETRRVVRGTSLVSS